MGNNNIRRMLEDVMELPEDSEDYPMLERYARMLQKKSCLDDEQIVDMIKELYEYTP